jgi:GNAT superfamily N-acetyltransferase
VKHSPSINRSRILAVVRHALEPQPFVLAMWEGGAAAWARTDAWSDIDLQILVEDGSADAAFALVEGALESLSPIELRFAAPRPTWHGHDQVFYRLQETDESLLVDLVVMKRSSRNQLRERERHGERVIHFDKTGEAAPVTLDHQALRARIDEQLAQLRIAFEIFQCLTKKELQRGNPLGALASYHSHTLGPLLALLRIRHCPERFDFGLRYSAADLPVGVTRSLEELWFVGDVSEIAVKRERAERMFNATLAELDAKQLDCSKVPVSASLVAPNERIQGIRACEVEIFVEPVEVATDREAVRRGIEATQPASPADHIRKGLALYNVASEGELISPLNVYLRGSTQQVDGGLLGRTGASALFIAVLWVAEPFRRQGYGRQLVLTAEREALRRGCHFSHVDTFSFHAPEFYRRLGYEVFGVLDGYKSGHVRYFLKKSLAARA